MGNHPTCSTCAAVALCLSTVLTTSAFSTGKPQHHGLMGEPQTSRPPRRVAAPRLDTRRGLFFVEEEEERVSADRNTMDAYERQMQEYQNVEGGSKFTDVPPQPTSRPPEEQPEQSVAAETRRNSSGSRESQSPQSISSVDARVLESILAEGKLDVSTEEQVQQLLDGPRIQEELDEAAARYEEQKDSKYSSKFVSTVADDGFWNSLKAKAEDFIESVGIYIENRVERDAKTLAAVGLFAADRIRKDIGRALPSVASAAGRVTKQLLLSTNSTVATKIVEATEESKVFALPSERTLTERELMTTPEDEIKAVTEALRDILSGKDYVDESSDGNRGISSFAPAGTSKLSERQKRAYKARKSTVIKREQEGIDRKVGRAFGSVTDTAWELKREMQTDKGREAGYRSRVVRQALASGATRLLEAGRSTSRLLSGEKGQNKLKGGVSVVTETPEGILDISAEEEAEIIEAVMDEGNMDYAPSGLLSPQSFVDEKMRLVSTLEACLATPSETWLTQDVVAESAQYGVTLDGDVLREVITGMVSLRDGLINDVDMIEEGLVDLKIEFVQSGLLQMKEAVDGVVNLAVSAVGESAAILLKQQLEGYTLTESLDNAIASELEQMEKVLAQKVSVREQEIQSQRYQDVVVEPEVFANSQRTAQTSRWNSEVAAEVEIVSDNVNGGYASSYTANGDTSNVEVMSDSEYTEFEQNFKKAESADASFENGVEENQENNPAGDFVLRVVDVLFFVGEKFFLGILPDLITGTVRASSKYAEANNRGRGTVGWKQSDNLKKSKKVY